MGIEVARLENELLRMSAEAAPGREFCQAIAKLAQNGRFFQLKGILPGVVFDEMEVRYRRNPSRFASEWKQLGESMQMGFIENARQKLTSLVRLRQQSEVALTPEWMEIQRALDVQENDLLRTAFTFELLQMVEPAVLRATQLRECVVSASSSEDADRYLDEATRCYFYGMFTACAVMCRSVLEEAIKQKLPDELARLVRSRYRNTATLGNLLHEVNNNLQLCKIDADFPRLANMVNDSGKKAVHQGLLSEDEARSCLENARSALQMLLGQ